MSDTLKKFLFEDRSVRIESVQLTQTWIAAQAHHTYPPCVAAQLGELVAAATLLSATLKFDGSLLLQLQGDGAIALMVVECRADLSVRATIKMRERALPTIPTLQSLVNPGGTAKFIVVLDPPKHTPGRQVYQGIVPLEGDTIAEALEQYMLRSEQLETRIWLAADSQYCTGLLLQRLPVQGGNQQVALSTAQESWERAQHLAQTLTQAEMLSVDRDTILHRLFWEEVLHSFEPRGITWRCSCSHQRVADMLRMLGKAEVQDMFEERDTIDIACEFCGQPYTFDSAQATTLFSAVH
ncbi:Hsp33 family molecular chaperone HslO [Alcaligenaceae bacterium LF4-65]|uniref:Hsp33 family molecular chaperone HslO n=1 Tax=Zwartia hollandica TaxID=324606 RepID=A0A953N9L9_9BURK|nr:Hsp33 family molecular chaperone HslO [Zwartia hollandica]MBZ1351371.1 Hsp33 family molecular chaperone HslO [Zwartia hollandica]